MRIDEKFAGIGRAGEGERGFFARRNDRAEKYGTARAGAHIERYGSDKRPCNARLTELAANLKALLGVTRSEFHPVVRNAGPADVLFKEPIHRMTTLEGHFGGHHRFDLALKLLCRESLLRVFGDERVEESDEAGIGIFGIRLAEHFMEHVHNPGSLRIDDFLVGIRRLRRVEASAHKKGANIGGGESGGGRFSDQALAVAIEPETKCAIGSLPGVGKEKGKIRGNGLVNPLVAIAGPANDVSPPLMGDLMNRNKL